jgi:hypothetical protein
MALAARGSAKTDAPRRHCRSFSKLGDGSQIVRNLERM